MTGATTNGLTHAPPADVLPADFVEYPTEPAARDLLGRLHVQTRPMTRNPSRPPLYNAPDVWVARHDGEIVRAAGDAQNQAYLRSKGFHILTPDEAEEWEQRVRPLVVKEQKRRASLITTLRRIAQKHPGVEVAGDLEITPTEELEGMLTQLKQITGGNVAVVMGRFREEERTLAPAAAGDPDTRDVQLRDATELERKLAASAAALASGRVRDAGGKFVAG